MGPTKDVPETAVCKLSNRDRENKLLAFLHQYPRLSARKAKMSNQIALPGVLSPDVTWPIPAVIIRACNIQ